MAVVMQLSNLKRLMRSQGLTFRELAEKTGNDPSHLHNLSTGSICATAATASKIALALDVSIVSLTTPPNVQDAINDFTSELRVYRQFIAAVYEHQGIRIPF